MPQAARKRESGYALLFILLTVAVIGIMYYAAMPHVVFEAQRDQEEMLIDRGEQYKRAIQLYYRKFKKYPAKIDDLENTSGQRFLRQRYKDPMTGKDEWRPIHIGPNGQFIDSLTQKSNQKKQDPASVNNFITELKPLGDAAGTGNAPVNLGLRHRPSDTGGAGGTGGENPDPNFSATGSNGEPPEVDQPLLEGPDPVVGGNGASQPNGQNGIVTGNPNGIGAGNGANFNGNNFNNGNNLNGNNLNGNNLNGNNLNNGGIGNGLSNGLNPNANNFNSGNSNNGFPNQNPVPGQNSSGADMIRNMLTSPRPGGPPPGIFPNANPTGDPGLTGQQNQFPQATNTTNVGGAGGAGTGFGGSTVGTPAGAALGSPAGQTLGGGGIAGFASKAERPGIKIYNEKHKYNEWEFIYDYAKDKTMGGGQTVPVQNGTLNGPGQSSNPGSSNPGASNPGASNPGASNPGISSPGTSNTGTSNAGSAPTTGP